MTLPGAAGRRMTDLRDLGRLLLGHLAWYRHGRLQDLATAALRDEDGGRRWIVPAVNATIRVRQSLSHALWLTPRRLVSRVRFAARAPGRELPATRLSLICPTRGRPGRLAAFLRSVDRTVRCGDRVEVLCYVDEDDPELAGYRELAATAGQRFPRIGRCALHVGEPVGVPATWNVLAARADGDYLLMANDDQMYVTYGWDVRLDAVAAALRARDPDGAQCLYFDAGQYPEGGEDFPIISRPWYEALGYFGPTIFQQWSGEKWIFDIARKADRLHPVPGVFVDHLHYQDYKAPFDLTYQRHRMSRETSFADRGLFLRTEPDRVRQAHKLVRATADRAAAPPSASATVDGVDPPIEEVAMTTAEQAAQPTGDVGTRSYIMQMARRHYSNLIDAWHYGGRADLAKECAELAVRQGVWPHPLQRAREFVPGLKMKPLHDPSQFWFISYLEEHYPQIREEIERVLDTPTDPVQPTTVDRGPVKSGSWRQAHLFRDGQWQRQVCETFPVTAAILSEIPEVSTFSPGVIMISRLSPGTHIVPHCGPTNAMLRIHLGIGIPPGVRLRVGEEWLTWEEGRCLIFDDSYEHEVRHEGSEDRVVLILDMLHPDLRGDLRERQLQQRLAFEEQIIAFLKERGLERIELTDGDLVFYPDAGTRDTAALYMAATGIVGAEIRGSEVVWRHAAEQGVSRR